MSLCCGLVGCCECEITEAMAGHFFERWLAAMGLGGHEDSWTLCWVLRSCCGGEGWSGGWTLF